MTITRDKILRFALQAAAVSLAVWLALIANQAPASWQASAIPFALTLTAAAWSFRTVLNWVLRN